MVRRKNYKAPLLFIFSAIVLVIADSIFSISLHSVYSL